MSDNRFVTCITIKLAQVSIRTEGIALARKDDTSDVIIVAKLRHRLKQLICHLLGERVQVWWSIECEGGYVVLLVETDGVKC